MSVHRGARSRARCLDTRVETLPRRQTRAARRGLRTREVIAQSIGRVNVSLEPTWGGSPTCPPQRLFIINGQVGDPPHDRLTVRAPRGEA